MQPKPIRKLHAKCSPTLRKKKRGKTQCQGRGNMVGWWIITLTPSHPLPVPYRWILDRRIAQFHFIIHILLAMLFCFLELTCLTLPSNLPVYNTGIISLFISNLAKKILWTRGTIPWKFHINWLRKKYS